MRLGISIVGAFALVLSAFAGGAYATDPVMLQCAICTCQNEAVICVDIGGGETVEEQGPCAGPCSSVMSSFQSIELVERACEDLPTCDHAQAPAASPLWLAGGAVALLLLGGAALRRMRAAGAPD